MASVTRGYCVALAILHAGCGGTASGIQLSPAGGQVRTGTADAHPQLVEIGPIKGVHGHGCGAFGRPGNYDSAYAQLRNEAATRGAVYVKIVQVLQPQPASGCFDQRFILRGIAYAPPASPSPARATAPQGPRQPQPPARVDPGRTIRSGVESRRETVLQCTSGASTTVIAGYTPEGNVSFSLAADHAGTEAEGCVRSAFGAVRIDTGGQAGAVPIQVEGWGSEEDDSSW